MSNAFKKSFSKLTNAVGLQAQVKSVTEAVDEFLSKDAAMLLQSMPDSVSLHDANGNALWVSDKTNYMFCLNAENQKDKGFLEAINPQDKLDVLKAFSDCSTSGKNQTVMFRCQFAGDDGKFEVSHFEVRISPYPHKGEIVFLALARDVSAEAKREVQAKQDIESAQNLSSTKSMFLSHMSHELRTPLNAIIGFSQMLMGEAAVIITDEKKTEYAGLINQSASHLLKIINDILDISKIEAGKFQIIPEVINLEDEVQASLKLLAPIADEAGVSIAIKAMDNLPNITADPRAIQQIVMNLIANAIKFSHRGDTITVLIERNRRKIELKIIDTGLGMEQDTLDKLGSSFFQAEQNTTKRFEGTGLGLSIVFGLIKLHNGQVSFESKQDSGTTVCVELPISNEKSIPVPADPNEAIVFLNETREPNLFRKLETNSTVRKTG